MVKEIQVEFTDKLVMAWGVMKLMKDMIDSISIKEFMSGLVLPQNAFSTCIFAIFKLHNGLVDHS